MLNDVCNEKSENACRVVACAVANDFAVSLLFHAPALVVFPEPYAVFDIASARSPLRRRPTISYSYTCQSGLPAPVRAFRALISRPTTRV